MSRFNNLEFSDDSNQRSRRGGKALVRDEGFFMAEAEAAFASGEYEQGLRNYAKVLEYNPNNAVAWTGQVRMLIELGECDEAKLWADKALERFPNEPELLAAKAVALGRSGDLQGALAFSDASISERGDTPYVWLARGDVLLARTEQRANYCFDKALMLAPGDWLVLTLAARIRMYYEQFILALKLIQQAVELNPGHFLVWLVQGQCQHELGMAGAAAKSLKQAEQLNSRSPAVRDALQQVSQSGIISRWRSRVRKLFKS